MPTEVEKNPEKIIIEVNGSVDIDLEVSDFCDEGDLEPKSPSQQEQKDKRAGYTFLAIVIMIGIVGLFLTDDYLPHINEANVVEGNIKESSESGIVTIEKIVIVLSDMIILTSSLILLIPVFLYGFLEKDKPKTSKAVIRAIYDNKGVISWTSVICSVGVAFILIVMTYPDIVVWTCFMEVCSFVCFIAVKVIVYTLEN